MNKEHTLLTYDELMDELQSLCADKRTGTMFIVTDVQHTVRFSMSNGDITGLAYRLQSGMDALSKIMQMNGGKYHFADGIFSTMQEAGFPDTRELIQTFRNKSSNIIPAPSSSKSKTSSAIPQVDSHAISLITTELTEFLGPFASMSIDDYRDEHLQIQSKQEIRAMIDTLAVEIDNHSDALQFKKNIMAKL
jgi:hypothetical protein